MRGSKISGHLVLSQQFDCDKNGELRAEDVSINESRKAIWWRCEKGHSWAISPLTRIVRKSGAVRPCPCCSGRIVSVDNNLSVTHGDLCEEWDYEKNKFGPESVTHKMAVKVWWKCRYGHEWAAQVYSRADGKAGCPKCSCKQTSHIELRVYSELKSVFPDAERDVSVGRWRVDVVLPSHRTAIEVDSSHWHEKKIEVDTRKDADLAHDGYQVIRVRERSLHPTGCETVWYKDGESHLVVCERVVRVLADRFNVPVRYSGWKNEELFVKLLSEIGGYGTKVVDRLPSLLKEWHPTKNGKLRLEDLTVGTHIEVWWICPRKHEYRMMINERSRGRGCPYCSSKRVLPENSVSSNPVSQEWAEELNVKPACDFTRQSNKKAWWRCKNGHIWNASIASRTKGSGCPYCSRKRKSRDTVIFNQKATRRSEKRMKT